MNFQNFSFRLTRVLQRRTLTKIKLTHVPNPRPELNVTICGANSKIGKISAMLLKKENLFKNIILWDEDHDMTELIMSDLSAIKTNTKFKTFYGRNGLIDAVSDSRIIYICNNIQTVPGLFPLDMFKSNANSVRQIILYVSKFNPTAMIVIATPSVTSLVPMAYEEMLKDDCDAGKQIFGVARNYLGIANVIANNLTPKETFNNKHYVIGGCDKDTCIPVFSNSSGRILSVPEFSAKPETTKLKGAKDALKLFQQAEENALRAKVLECNTDGCYLSLAAAGYKFILNLAKALNGEKNITDYAFVKQKKPRNYNERYFTCKVNLNKEGLESCEIPKLSPVEEQHLQLIDKQLNAYIHAGEVYITGRDQIPEHRKKIEKPKEEPKPEPIIEPIQHDVFCDPRSKPQSIVVKNE